MCSFQKFHSNAITKIIALKCGTISMCMYNGKEAEINQAEH